MSDNSSIRKDPNDLKDKVVATDSNEGEGEVTDFRIPEGADDKEVDKGYALAQETEGLVLDPVKEKKLVRKIDLYILSTMCALMSCQLMGKSSNSYASIMGLREDLHMSSKEYSWVGAGFYLGYLVFEYPATFILQKFPMSRVLGIAIIFWGIILCCHGACQSSTTFILCRVLLALGESFMDPAYLTLTVQYYKKEEQYIRCAFWLGLQGFGTMLGSGIAYGFYTHQDSMSIRPWTGLYIVVGMITIAFGILSYIHVPSVPTDAWFFNKEEKAYVVERVRNNRTGFGNKQFKMSQVKEALTDPTIYLFFFYMFGYGYSNGALGNYGSIILHDYLGFSTGQSLLFNMVGSGQDIVFPLFFAYVNKYLIKSRLTVAFIINAVVWSGLFCLAYSTNRGAKAWGYFMNYWLTASWATMASIVQTNVAGHTKKGIANALFLIGFSLGNILGPLSFSYSKTKDDQPNYKVAGSSMVGVNSLTCILPIVLLFIYRYRNKKKEEQQSKAALIDDNHLSFGDMTDFENPAFRYVI